MSVSSSVARTSNIYTGQARASYPIAQSAVESTAPPPIIHAESRQFKAQQQDAEAESESAWRRCHLPPITYTSTDHQSGASAVHSLSLSLRATPLDWCTWEEAKENCAIKRWVLYCNVVCFVMLYSTILHHMSRAPIPTGYLQDGSVIEA